jgi:hypothetical protein
MDFIRDDDEYVSVLSEIFSGSQCFPAILFCISKYFKYILSQHMVAMQNHHLMLVRYHIKGNDNACMRKGQKDGWNSIQS